MYPHFSFPSPAGPFAPPLPADASAAPPPVPPVPSFTVSAGPFYAYAGSPDVATLTDTSTGTDPSLNVWQARRDGGAWEVLDYGAGPLAAPFDDPEYAGTWEFRLTVTGDGVTGFGTASYTGGPITVYAAVAAAVYSVTPNPIDAGNSASVFFSATGGAGGGSPSGYTWKIDVGGGFESIIGNSPEVRNFGSSGTFDIRIQATDTNGRIGTSAPTTLVVNDP